MENAAHTHTKLTLLHVLGRKKNNTISNIGAHFLKPHYFFQPCNFLQLEIMPYSSHLLTSVANSLARICHKFICVPTYSPPMHAPCAPPMQQHLDGIKGILAAE